MVGAATLGGGALAATDMNPIAMLFWTAVINGVIAVPIMLAMMVVVSSRNLNRKLKLHLGLKCLGWLGTALMTIAVAFLLVSSVV
jgi:Mn2+/Fe2+ NRAMP family transporter